MDFDAILKNFLDSEGRLAAFPSKRKMKKYALLYVASKFDGDRKYTEKEVNALINEHCTLNDPETIRRELYDNKFLGREHDGRSYWLEERQPTLAELGLDEC